MSNFISNLMLKLKRSDLCIGASEAKGKGREKKKTLNPCIYLLLYNLAEKQFEMMRRGGGGEEKNTGPLVRRELQEPRISFCSISRHFHMANVC